ncbi:ATP-binding cassette transporter CGR1 [Meristemomyces frigidus]|uniref:Phytoene desaturase n=1 Tax=Meristemomyces frigidus TaxID=1508187 RepID=A0AAN7YGP3_9PEZI|nr:ATP-binding cassette transporter CGR1 [Meristemomyces frigidus]
MAPKEKTGGARKTAIVIGAGIGGVSTAARLAHAGFTVTVVEKNSFTGGRCSLLRSPNNEYRFDQGPSLLLLPRLFHQTFAELDTSLEREGVELVKCEPNYRVWFGDGEEFVLSTDLARMKKEVERWEGTEGYERYLGFLGESHKHYELSVTHVLLRNFTSLASMCRPSFLRHLVALHPFESIWGRASKYFHTERLRRVFTFGSMYMGMSPFDAPGTYSLLQYTELAEGIWYPIGGFHRVVEALVGIGERLGVVYRMGCEVEEIVVRDGGARATGVRLKGGEVLAADVVVNNSDLVYAYTHLLPDGSSKPSTTPEKKKVTPYAESLARREASCSSISFYWGLSQKIPALEAHNIFLADEYRESFDSIFKKHLIPDEPSFYVNVPSRVDGSAAPKGKDSVVVLVPVGHLVDDAMTTSAKQDAANDVPVHSKGNGSTNGEIKHTHSTISATSPPGQSGLQPTTTQDWPAMISLARTTILRTIQQRTGVDIEPLIVHEETNDPQTWKQKFNLDRGAILGLSHSFFNVLSFRPSTRARRGNKWLDGWLDRIGGGGVAGRVSELIGDLGRGRHGNVSGLYMVGASAHPGTGVPICLAGGRLVAEQVLEDLGMVVPWWGRDGDEQEKGKGKVVGGLDEVKRPFDPRAFVGAVVVLLWLAHMWVVTRQGETMGWEMGLLTLGLGVVCW